MPLKLSLKPGEKFVLNGAVVQNGDRRCSLVLQNKASVLREKDILQLDEAKTPSRRIYFPVMMMYIDEAAAERQYDEFLRRMNGLIAEALGWNRRMWSVLGIECASEDNGLPAELRASIISLSIWVDKYTSKVMLGDGDIADLIDINRIIMAGLNTNDSDRADRNVTARDSAHGGEAAQVAL